MANFFATGHGLIGGYLARQEKDNLAKKERDAISAFLTENGLSDPAADPTATPSIAQAFKPAPQQADPRQQALALGTAKMDFGLDNYAAQQTEDPVAAKINQQFGAMMGRQQDVPLAGQDAPAQSGGRQPYADPRTPFSSFAVPAGAAATPQAPQQIPERTQALSADWLNQAAAKLIKQGLSPERAIALATTVYSQRKAADAERQSAQYAPQYIDAATKAFKANDRAAAFAPLMQLQKLGYKIPVEMLTWMNPNKQHFSTDTGGQEINSSFDPSKSGPEAFSIGQAFNKTQTPDNAANNQLGWAKFGYQKDRDALGDAGKTWQSRRKGKNGDDPEDVDPGKVAKNTGAYRKFMQGMVQDADGNYRGKAEVQQYLGNANVKRQIAALASAAGITPEQLRNDIAHIQSKLE